MKKLISIVLAMACVLCLLAGCVEPDAPTTSSTQNQTPSTSSKPTDPSDPSKPSEPKPVGPITPATGDRVHIFLPDSNLAVGYNANGKKLEGVAGTVTDGVLTAEGAGVFEVIVDDDGMYTFVCGGKYLTTIAEGNALSLEYDPSEYSLWTLEKAADGTFYIKSNAVYKGQAQYLEYYKDGFTTF